jgi:hypothetical protein
MNGMPHALHGTRDLVLEGYIMVRFSFSSRRGIHFGLRGVAVLLALLAGSSAVHASSNGQTKGTGTGPVTGTILLKGSMASSVTLTMTGAFSVGSLSNLDWNLPVMTSMQVSGYTETVTPPSFVFSVQPDSSSDFVDSQGIHMRRFHWSSPPRNTVIKLTETVQSTVTSPLTTFTSKARYPVVSAELPASATPYLQNSPQTKLPLSASALVKKLVGKRSSEGTVVRTAENWLVTHVKVESGSGGDAASALSTRTASSSGYTNLMAGLLRAMGIPTRVENGWIVTSPIVLPSPNGAGSEVQWTASSPSGAMGAWLSVYFPDIGWVAFDPQIEKFFVDPRHVQFFSSLDAGSTQVGTWTGMAEGDQPATNPLPGGIDQIVPGAPGSIVTVSNKDSFNVTLAGLIHDLKKSLLFSRA